MADFPHFPILWDGALRHKNSWSNTKNRVDVKAESFVIRLAACRVVSHRSMCGSPSSYITAKWSNWFQVQKWNPMVFLWCRFFFVLTSALCSGVILKELLFAVRLTPLRWFAINGFSHSACYVAWWNSISLNQSGQRLVKSRTIAWQPVILQVNNKSPPCSCSQCKPAN